MTKIVRFKGPSESAVQQSYIVWFTLFYPQYIVFSIPNNSRRNPREGARLKREGMRAGIPDVMIPVPKGEYHGLFIEFKVGRNKLTESQKSTIDYLTSMKYFCVVCYSFDEAMEVTNRYLKG